MGGRRLYRTGLTRRIWWNGKTLCQFDTKFLARHHSVELRGLRFLSLLDLSEWIGGDGPRCGGVDDLQDILLRDNALVGTCWNYLVTWLPWDLQEEMPWRGRNSPPRSIFLGRCVPWELDRNQLSSVHFRMSPRYFFLSKFFNTSSTMGHPPLYRSLTFHFVMGVSWRTVLLLLKMYRNPCGRESFVGTAPSISCMCKTIGPSWAWMV
jgi:hypothetical protein